MKQQKNKNMKKIAFVASLAIIAFAVTAFIAPKVSTGGTAFEGVVTYSISVDNPQAATMTQGSSMKVYLKGDKTKTMIDMGMSKQIMITDKKTPDDPIILLEIMGNKYQLKKDKIKKDEAKDPEINYGDETKQIAGYTCHKAQITVTDEQGQATTTDVYYTEALPAYEGKSGQFKGLKGFPLQYAIKQQGMNILMAATSVDKQSVSDDTFTVPSGYKLMTPEEMQADLQKSMGGN